MGKSDSNAVVVVLGYYTKGLRASGTISFRGPRPDMKVLEAKAEMVEGVQHALGSIGGNGQVLEITVTPYHARTREGAGRVMQTVIRQLGLSLLEGQVRVVVDAHKTKRKAGSKSNKSSKKKTK